MVRTQISLTEEQHQGLIRLAARQSISMSALIRRAVDDTLSDAERGKQIDEAIRLVRQGGFSGGDRDVAREHDRELDEAFGS